MDVFFHWQSIHKDDNNSTTVYYLQYKMMLIKHTPYKVTIVPPSPLPNPSSPPASISFRSA